MPNPDSTIHLDSSQDARLLRQFFRDSGYEVESLTTRLGRVIAAPSRVERNLPLLLHATREPDRQNTLLRWFVIGLPEQEKKASVYVPEQILRLLVETRLLVRENGALVPAVVLLPYEDLLIASDKLQQADPAADVVIGFSASGRLLMYFTQRRKVDAALDLGCGGGVQALKLADHCAAVTAADLNPRALVFGRFNARLNGKENIEFVQGDCFAPVEGRRFDLITINPPFFLLPPSGLLYRDNPIELDGFCRELVRQAPRYLNEGGLFQMIFEWVEIEGQPWRERLAPWVEGSGCDVWVARDYVDTPAQYCDTKMRSIDQQSLEQDVETLARCVEYHRRHRVVAMHGGVIAMRKRSAPRNWVEMEEVPFKLARPFGDAVEQFFVAQDLTQDDAAEDELLATFPRLSPRVRLECVSVSCDGGWAEPAMSLRMDHGFQRICRVDAQVAAHLGQFNGQRTLRELLALLSPSVETDAAQLRAHCLGVIRQLIQRGFVVVA